MTNVIEMPNRASEDARHPADQPTPLERAVEAARKAWGEDVQEHNVPETPREQLQAIVDADAVKVSQPKETPPSVRTIARQTDVDLKPLLKILELQRPAHSITEALFVEGEIGSIEGMQKDEYGNHYLTIGDNPTIMWSCHTDTVAKDDGRQNVKWDGDFLVLNDPKPGQCLGADDGAGIWLLLEMIKAKVPGLYIFHREEEIGRQGSEWIAKHNLDLIKDIKIAIAFDRRDVDSVITHQSGQRGCSDKFSAALAKTLNQVPGLKYCDDPTGSYTDTYSYIDIIPEVTNVACGYYSEHSAREKLDVRHLLRLREALISFDFSDLPVERDPSVTEYDGYGYGGWGNSYSRSYSRPKAPTDPIEKIQAVIKDRTYSVAKMLYNMGLDDVAVEDMIYNLWQRSTTAPTTMPSKPKVKDDHEESVADYLRRTGQDEAEDLDDSLTTEALYCHDCGDYADPDYIFGMVYDGYDCPECFGQNTEMVEVERDAIGGEVLQ